MIYKIITLIFIMNYYIDHDDMFNLRCINKNKKLIYGYSGKNYWSVPYKQLNSYQILVDFSKTENHYHKKILLGTFDSSGVLYFENMTWYPKLFGLE
jgi:hypothetical protein